MRGIGLGVGADQGRPYEGVGVADGGGDGARVGQEAELGGGAHELGGDEAAVGVGPGHDDVGVDLAQMTRRGAARDQPHDAVLLRPGPPRAH